MTLSASLVDAFLPCTVARQRHLQNAFYEYLEERGIHDDLAAALSDYARLV